MPDLPISRVVLYKHGVGYFEREGVVEGDVSLALTFKQGEVSDVLKSLTILDLDGGHVAAVSYDSTKPIEQLLAEIALSIPDRESLVTLVPQLKGARVVVKQKDETLEGMLLGVDTVELDTDTGIAKIAFGSLLTDAGDLKSFPLHESGLTLLDEGLRRDLDFYLRTQLSAKKKDARTFTLFAQGQGRRRVRMSYVLEAPVWKATYRILLSGPDEPSATERKQPLIQGWAVVDNMQDEDWNEVDLALIAGLPVSFVHDLYTPRYIKRPVVAVRETTGVLPPEVETGVEAVDSMLVDFDDSTAGGGGTLSAGLHLSETLRKANKQELEQTIYGSAVGRHGAPSSVQTQVRERQVGDLFEYEIERPVTIRRNQSALVPIVLKPFDGRSVLLYQKAARAENPMRSVEFENTTGLTLEGGPVTVLEGDSYVGEAMLETMKPKEKRLVPYAVELSVRAMDSIDSHREDVRRVVIRKGILYAHQAQVMTTTYTLINKAEREYTLYLDHPRGGNEWKLTDTPDPHETTDNYWRFRFTLPAGKTTKFTVRQQQPLRQQYGLGDLDDRQLGVWLDAKYLDKKTEKVLREVVALRQQALDLNEQFNRLHKERSQIHEEQKRIRENLNSLGDRSSEKELRERFVRTLNTQEDRLEEIDSESKRITRERDDLLAKKNEVLASLEFEGEVK
jgi:predicted nuclease with TOPRIM domain